MNKETEQQLLRNPDIAPTSDVLAAALGNAYETYRRFTDMLDALEIQPEWRYYNDSKAWLGKGLYKWKSPRGTSKEKTVFWLSIWDGFFRLSFFISEKRWESLQNLQLSDSAKEAISGAKKIGKLKFYSVIFSVRIGESFSDFSALIEFQKNIK